MSQENALKIILRLHLFTKKITENGLFAYIRKREILYKHFVEINAKICLIGF